MSSLDPSLLKGSCAIESCFVQSLLISHQVPYCDFRILSPSPDGSNMWRSCLAWKRWQDTLASHLIPHHCITVSYPCSWWSYDRYSSTCNCQKPTEERSSSQTKPASQIRAITNLQNANSAFCMEPVFRFSIGVDCQCIFETRNAILPISSRSVTFSGRPLSLNYIFIYTTILSQFCIKPSTNHDDFPWEILSITLTFQLQEYFSTTAKSKV